MPPAGYRRPEDLPQVIAVFPLEGVLLLPGAQLPLNIFEPRYLNMIDDALASHRMIGMIQTRPGGDRTQPNLAPIGCLGRITSFSETGDGRYLITLSGLVRFEAGEELSVQTPYRQVRARYQPFAGDLNTQPDGVDAIDRDAFLSALRRYMDHKGLDLDWAAAEGAPADALVNSLAMALPFESAEKQALLEAATVAERGQALIAMLEIDAAGLGDDEPPSLQ